MTTHTDPVPRFERKVFGEHETVCLEVDQYIRMPQVRSEMNPRLSEIKDSIEERGLLNTIDVARMTEEQLSTYVDFVNRTWGTEVKTEQYLAQQQDDGYYYLVVAGHTRTEAIQQLQDADPGVAYELLAKVHPISDPQEIIALQLDENLHSTPPQEQRAIAIVETYRYGMENGLWANKGEFLEESRGKFSRKVLNEAIGFAQLPSEARDFVFAGRLSYNAAVALGAATDTILDYTAARLGYDGGFPHELVEALDESYRTQVGLMIAEISNRSLNGTAAKKYISGQIGIMKQYLERRNADSDENALFDLSMVTADEQAEVYLKDLRRRYEAALRLMKLQNVEVATQALSLHRQLKGEEGSETIVEDLKERRKRLLGSGAINSQTSLL